jgi:hypothetical protein
MSIKMMIVLNSLTSLNNECLMLKRVNITASDAIKTMYPVLDYKNYNIVELEAVHLFPGTLVKLTKLELTLIRQTCLQIK